MEYCGAGSVSDIIRLRRKTLTEDEIATVLRDTLKGLEYGNFQQDLGGTKRPNLTISGCQKCLDALKVCSQS